MTARRIIVPDAMPSRDPNGRALPAKLRFYEPTGTLDTLKAVYTSNTLSVALAQPILSDANGRFPAIWGDSAETWDVGYTDQVYDANISGPYTNVTTLTDVAAAAMTQAEAAADAAEAAETAAEAAAATAVAATAGKADTDLDNVTDEDFGAKGFTALGTEARTLVERFSDFVNVADFGAVGDGTTDDTLKIRAAITAAGVNGTVLFVPGKTYRLTGFLPPLQGQTWIGYGAKLKRCNSIATTTAQAISAGAGPTNIQVTSSASFTVGMDVVFYQSASVFDPAHHRITAIPDGTHITVNTDFTQALNSGSGVATGFYCVDAQEETDVTILGLEIDGNRSNNANFARWELHGGIYGLGDRMTVRDCYIHDEVSEGMVFGGDASLSENNRVRVCGGNGIHFSSSIAGKSVNDYVYDVNKLGSVPGHADGCIIFSDATGDCQIVAPYCDTGICGVGSIDTNDNSRVTILGGTIKNMTSSAIEGQIPLNEKGGRVIVDGVTIIDSVKIAINYDPGTYDATYGPYGWMISNCRLTGTRVDLTGAKDVLLNNVNIDLAGDTTTGAINIVNSRHVKVQGGRVTGGAVAVFIDGSDSSDISIADLDCLNQYARGMNINAHNGRNVSVRGGNVTVETGFTTTDFVGILANANNTSVDGVEFDLQVGSGYHVAMQGAPGGASANGAIFTNCRERGANVGAAILLPTGSQKNNAKRNWLQHSVTDSGSNTAGIADNTTIL